MKLLFDFDGVLTDPSDEAARVAQIFREEIVRLGETTGEVVDGLIRMAERSFTKNPWAHGWHDQQRLSAFCNEDPFIRTNAIAACFDQWAVKDSLILSEIAALMRKADVQNFHALAGISFHRMAKETAVGGFNPLDVDAVHAVEAMLARGHEVVIVSSSSTDRIVNLLHRAGFEVADTQNPREGAKPRIRVRGDARKFVLGDEARAVAHGEYSIDTNRPHYFKILTEEKPDVVIGDVFSLDLTLPLSLWSEKAEGFSGVRIFLRKRHYTPEWSHRLCEEASRTGHAPLGVVSSIPEWLATLT